MRPSARLCAATSVAVVLIATASCNPWLALGPLLLQDDDTKNTGLQWRTTPWLVPGSGFSSISIGQTNNCVLTSGGLASCWGSNEFGSLGSGDTRSSAAAPVPVAGGHVFRIVSAGAGLPLTCGVRTDSAAYCWGLGQLGSLGTGSTATTIERSPVAVTGSHKFKTITTGGQFSCALERAGEAWCWGAGAIGAGADSTQYAPGSVTGGHLFDVLDAGAYHTCGITTAGAAYCWGIDFEGELGTGTAQPCGNINCPSPMLVTGAHTWTTISAGGSHTCAINSTDDAYCWGRGIVLGELGIGKDTSVAAPHLVAGGLKWSAISAGHEFTCGLTTAGIAYCWGDNSYGELGLGSQTPGQSNVPVAVAGSRVFTALDAGGANVCALTSEGRVYCWGVLLR